MASLMSQHCHVFLLIILRIYDPFELIKRKKTAIGFYYNLEPHRGESLESLKFCLGFKNVHAYNWNTNIQKCREYRCLW